MAPIVLWDPKSIRESDEAGITILKTVLAPQARSGTYQSHRTGNKLSYVPTLGYFCIQSLLEYPEQIYVMGPARLRYMRTRHGFEILQALVPSWGSTEFSMARVDPRLWALLVQIYTNLPKIFASYNINLSDPYLPLLQRIPPTPDFALVTILDLRKCRDLTDKTIISLKALHNLCVMDASETRISGYGIKSLARTLIFNEDGERRGPWALRILRLRDCERLDSVVFQYLSDFPLLCAVDLRGTRCRPNDVLPPFGASSHDCLFDPISLPDSLNYLRGLHSTLFSHREPFTISITNSRPAPVASTPLTTEGAIVTLPPSSGSTITRLKAGRGGKMQIQSITALSRLEALARIGKSSKTTEDSDRFPYYGICRCCDDGTCEQRSDSGGEDPTTEEDYTLSSAEEEMSKEDQKHPLNGPGEGEALLCRESVETNYTRLREVLRNRRSSDGGLSATGSSADILGGRLHASQHGKPALSNSNSQEREWIRQQNEAVQEETSRHNPRRAAQQFYQNALVPVRRVVKHDVVVSLKLRGSALGWKRAVDDPSLMLYRPPPAWSELEARMPSEFDKESDQNRGCADGRLFDRGAGKETVKSLTEMMGKRRRTTLADLHKKCHLAGSERERSLFSRSSFQAGERADHLIQADNQPEGAASSSSSGGRFKTAIKVLRPISNLKPPPLPGSGISPRLKLERADPCRQRTCNMQAVSGSISKGKSTSSNNPAETSTTHKIEGHFHLQANQCTDIASAPFRLEVHQRAAGGKIKQKREEERANSKKGTKRARMTFDWQNWSRPEPR